MKMTVVNRYFTDYVEARRCLSRGCGRKMIPLSDGRWLVTWEAWS